MVNERDRSALRQVCDVYSQRTRSVGPPSEGRCCRLVIERIEMKPFLAIRRVLRQSQRERVLMLITRPVDNTMISPSEKYIALLTEGRFLSPHLYKHCPPDGRAILRPMRIRYLNPICRITERLRL